MILTGSPSFTLQHVLFGVLISVIVIPSISSTIRILSSPLGLFFLSPLVLLFVVLSFIGLNIALGLGLDYYRIAKKKAKPVPRQNAHPLLGAARPLKFTTPAAWSAVQIRSQWSSASTSNLPPLISTSSALSTTLSDVSTLIIRDFILKWYTPISPHPAFPSSVANTIHKSLGNILSRAEKIDWAGLVVKRIIPKVTNHIDQFRVGEMAVRGAGLERHLTESHELDMLLASRYASQEATGRLHPAISNLSSGMTKQTEEAHLRNIFEMVLPLVLPKNEQSRAVLVVVREVLSCVVLLEVMELLSDPDFWNKAVDEAAGAAIRQQKLISKVRSLLDTDVPHHTQSYSHRSSSRVKSSVPINSRTTLPQFNAFLKSISRTDSLLDARRLKNDISNEIRKTRVLLANHDSGKQDGGDDEWIGDQRVGNVVAYLDRLYTARKKVEKRIAVLGGGSGPGDATPLDHHSGTPATAHRYTLREVLSNPSSLGYFMEFMDRRGRSLMVQFWLHVESFKNPLESVESGGESSGEDQLGPTNEVSGVSDTVKEDMNGIYDMYFSAGTNAPSASRGGKVFSLTQIVSRKHISTIRDFAHSSSQEQRTAKHERRVRRAVLLAQRQVEKEMEEDFGEFLGSELWFRAVGDLVPSSTTRRTHSTHSHPTTTDSSTLTKSISDKLFLTGSLPTIEETLERLQLKSPRPVSVGLERAETAPILSAQHSEPERSPLSKARGLSEEGPAQRASLFSESEPQAKEPIFLDVPNKAKGRPTDLDILLGAGVAGDEEEGKRMPLFDEEEVEKEREERERMEAIQAALTDIIADERRYEGDETGDGDRRRGSFSHTREESHGSSRRKGKGLFDDVDVDVDEGDENEDENEDEEEEQQGATFEPALPGDLQLSYDIARLTEKIQKLQSQQAILETLIQKAELTGDAQELRLLNRSKSAMDRELRALTFQRAQYEEQEAENRLVPDRTRVAIKNSQTVEEEGKGVVRYLIEVQQLAVDGSFASGWIVARRYSEFALMHQRLREKFVAVRTLDFPGKRLVTSMSSSFVDTRRVALEKYMQSLINIRLVCESDELRSFLSRKSPMMALQSPQSTSSNLFNTDAGGIVRTMYRSVTESIDDIFFGPSMLDVMIDRLTRQAAEFAGLAGSSVNDEDVVVQALASSSTSTDPKALEQIALPGDLKPLEGESGATSFAGPICDLILAVFELDKKNNWLRRQAVVIILQQVLGGTIERKLRELVKSNTDETHLLSYLGTFRNIMWPGGQLKPPGISRTTEEKNRTREEANRKLTTLMPDLAANMIGRSNARRGARRIFAVLQNRRLNQHLAYTILDEVIAALFPEAVFTPT